MFSESLEKLIHIPVLERNDEWERQFFANIPHSKLRVTHPAPTQEHDGWPYLHAQVSFEGGDDFSTVQDWLIARGIGLILNSHKSEPDYVFSYGMLWAQRCRGAFNANSWSPHTNNESAAEKLLVFPDYARAIVRTFLHEQGILAAKIKVIQDSHGYDFHFSLESLGHPPVSEHDQLLEAISWFFPPNDGLVLSRESSDFQLL